MARVADVTPVPGGRDESARGGGWNPLAKMWQFVQESVAELKKVEWPGQNQVVQGTVVVLVACLIVGLYLYLNDKLWSHFVPQVLLK